MIPYSPVEILVKRMTIHREFNPVNLHNDIAILQLERPVDFAEGNPQIGTVCLPDKLFYGQRYAILT